MKAQRAQNDPQKVLEDMERERKDMEEMFTIKAGEAEKLRENDVLSRTLLLSLTHMEISAQFHLIAL